jgi:hypothetical protein
MLQILSASTLESTKGRIILKINYSLSLTTNISSVQSKEDEPICEECEGELIRENGFILCRLCGLVSEPEFEESYYSLSFNFHSSSNVGTNLNPSLIKRNWNLMKFNRYVKEQFQILIRVCNNLELPSSIINRAKYIFNELYAKNSKHQNQILIAVAITQASRLESFPVLPDEILNAIRSFGRRITRNAYNKCLMDLNIKLPLYKPTDYIPRYLSKFYENFSKQDYPIPTFLYELLDLYDLFFRSSNPSSYAIDCIAISYNVVYGLNRYTASKPYRDNPTNYYNTLEKILNKYNERYKTNLIFKLKEHA